MRIAALVISVLALVSCAKKEGGLAAGPDFQKNLQEALITAKPGAVIEIPEGKHPLDRQISLSVANVTLRGKGMGKSILSFANQKSGSSGVLVTAGGFVIEDLAIEDARGDGLKINGADGVTIRRVRAEWTGGPKETNGAYGLYPVQCKNVLIEDSVVIGAADAGFYVGQSDNIIMRRNRAESNVAGMEVENSTHADVYDNVATKNTGGILVFNLPDLPVQGGSYTRVFNNQVIENNLANFAPKGNMVASVPAGTAIMVLATHHVEVFRNTIKGNGSYGVSVMSFATTGHPVKDAKYYPFTSAIYVHDNTMEGNGNNPDGRVKNDLEARLGKPIPALIYDGVFDPKTAKPMPGEARVCFQNNGGVTFANYDAAGGFRKISRDPKPHDCSHPALSAITLPNAPVAASAATGGGR
jgi:parallel beta-helix repeat protein